LLAHSLSKQTLCYVSSKWFGSLHWDRPHSQCRTRKMLIVRKWLIHASLVACLEKTKQKYRCGISL
jgi:hypothetical protein